MRNRYNATLLVDATNLYKIVFEGVKSYTLQKQNIHAVWGFLKKLRGLLAENRDNVEHPHKIKKVILFWDGKNSGQLRKNVLLQYKDNRNKYFEGNDPYYQQKNLIKEILGYLGYVSFSDDIVESDDCIAEYIRSHPQETIYIASSDQDYWQLISKNVYIFYLIRMKIRDKLYPKNILFNIDNFEYYFDFNYKNCLMRKIILGDESDNIEGVVGFGEKSIINEIPMFVKKHLDKESLITYVKEQLEKKKKSKKLNLLLDFLENDVKFDLNQRLISLKNDEFITSDCKSQISKIEKNSLNLKAFHDSLKLNGLRDQIKIDMDFYGDIREFTSPFIL